jgi:hypothetical protein
MKQACSSLLSDKLMLEKQLQQVNTSLESSKLKIARGEEQVLSYFCILLFYSIIYWQVAVTEFICVPTES